MSLGEIRLSSPSSANAGAEMPIPVPEPVVAPGAPGFGPCRGKGVAGADAAIGRGPLPRPAGMVRTGAALES
jgi:hypothetical protein